MILKEFLMRIKQIQDPQHSYDHTWFIGERESSLEGRSFRKQSQRERKLSRKEAKCGQNAGIHEHCFLTELVP